MKKQMSLFIWAVTMLGMSPVLAATNFGARAASSADLTGAPAERARTNVNYEKYQTRTSTRTYDVKDGKNLYYSAPQNRSALYKQYDAASRPGTSTTTTKTVRTTRAETVRNELKRKYYLAHPFFQPLKGKFGSITDLSYTTNSYDMSNTAQPFKIGEFEYLVQGGDGKWDMKRFSIKEDFSFGINDQIAVLAMGQYDFDEYKFDWDRGVDDKMDNNDLNMFGLGLQWRFLDNEKWIATASAYYQHQKDISNNLLAEIKAGYKVSSSTIYGLARGWMIDFKGNSYGNGVSGTDERGYPMTIYIPYDTDVDTTFYLEGGVGVFSVLDEDWTLNLEAIFGHYDWHQQGSIKGAIGWQPNDWFALNLYAKTAFYDSADGKKLDLYWAGVPEYDVDGVAGADAPAVNQLTKIGQTKLDKYSETSIGLQAILYF